MRVLVRRPPADGAGAARWTAPAGAMPLAAKAEVVLGVQLVTRHRAVHLAALLATAITAAAASSSPSVDRVARVMLWIGGTLAALAGSRLLAAGPALAAARMVVAPWWLAPLGRLLGALSVVVPATLGAGVAMLAAAHGPAPVARMAGVATAYAAAVAAVGMALAPLLGATGAAAVGVLGAWLGAANPSTVAGLLAAWPAVGHLVAWTWRWLPLAWRARRWLDGPGVGDPLVLVVWALLGVGLAGWRLAGSRGHAAGLGP